MDRTHQTRNTQFALKALAKKNEGNTRIKKKISRNEISGWDVGEDETFS